MDFARLLLVIAGDSAGAMAAVVEVNAGLDEMEGRINKAGGAANLLKSTFAAFAVVGTIIAGVGAITLKMAADFQSQMMLVRTQAHDTTDSMSSLEQQVLALAPAVGQGPDQLAEGLYHVTSVGYRGADAIQILTQAAKEATISGANLDDTTYSLTSVMNTFGLKAKDAHDTMAMLNSVVGAGDMKFQDLNGAISTGFLAAGDTFGVTLQSMGAALAYLTDRGASAEESATRLKMTVTLLGAPTKQAAGILGDLGLTASDVSTRTSAMEEALKKSGVSTTQLSDDLRKPDGIQVALTDLVTHMRAAGLGADETAAVLSRAFGGGKSGAAIMSMVQHLDILKTKFDSIGTGAARFDQDWQDALGTFSVQMNRARAGLDAIAISLGLQLLPVATRVMGFIADNMVPTFDYLSALAVTMGHNIGTAFSHLNQMGVLLPILSAIVAGFVAWRASIIAVAAVSAIGSMITWLRTAVAVIGEVRNATELWTAIQLILDIELDANPIGIVVIAVAALAAGIAALLIQNRGLRDELQRLWAGFRQAVSGVVDFIGQNQTLFTVIGVLSGPIGWLVLTVAAMATHWHQVTGALQSAWNWLSNLGGLVDKFNNTIGLYNGYLEAAYNRTDAAAHAIATWGVPFERARAVVIAVTNAVSLFHHATDAVQHVLSIVHDWLTRISMVLDVYRGYLFASYDRTTALGHALQTLGVPIQATTGFIHGLQSVIQSVSQAFHQAGQQLGPVASMLGRVLGDSFNQIKAALGGLQPALYALLDAFAPLWPILLWLGQVVLTQILEPALKNLGIVFAIVAVIIGALLAGVFTGLVRFLSVAIPAAVQVLVGVIQVIAGIVTFIADLWSGRWGKLGGDLKMILNGIVNMAMGLFTFFVTGISALVSGFVEGIVGFFQWLFTKLVGGSIIPDLVNAALSWFSNLVSGALNWIEQLVSGIVNKVANLVTKWAAEFVKILASVGQWELSVISIGVRAAQRFLDGVMGIIGQVAGRIGSTLWNAVLALGNWELQMLSKGDEAAHNLINRIVDILNGLPGQVYNIGTSIAHGIANGIQNAIGSVINAAKNLVSQAIGAAKAAAGNPHSPAPATIPLGKSLAEGVQAGVDSGAPDAKQSMSALIGGVLQQGTGTYGINANISGSLARGGLFGLVSSATSGAGPAGPGDQNAQLLSRMDRTNQILMAMLHGKSNVNGFTAALRQG